MILAHIAHTASSLHASASLAMFQEAASFSLTDMWSKMTWIPRGIVIILFIMSILVPGRHDRSRHLLLGRPLAVA